MFLIVGSRKEGSSVRKSARLERKRKGIPVEEFEGTNLSSKLHTDSEAEEDLVVVNQGEEYAASPSKVPDPNEWRERSPTPEFEEEIVLGSDTDEFSSDNMPTRLKYIKFRGDGSQDVDSWFSEFESIALANQEELETKYRIFQGLQKGEALKWYQDVPDATRNNWENFTPLFLRAFREARGEARALGRLSRITMKSSESVRK